MRSPYSLEIHLLSFIMVFVCVAVTAVLYVQKYVEDERNACSEAGGYYVIARKEALCIDRKALLNKKGE